MNNSIYRGDSLLLVISSPSGAGKSTLCKRLLEEDGLIKMSISVTTRPKRPSEQDGVDYYFVDKPQFENMVDNSELMEYARVFDYSYGTPKMTVEKHLQNGYDVLFDVDWQGAAQLRGYSRDNLVSIFILPPSMDELENRLRKRGQDSEEVIMKRMKKAKSEISHFNEYDYVVVNENVEDTLYLIRNIIKVERMKRRRTPKIDEFALQLCN
ncbi:MAG: guanylate kinase [Alphaproteobacteria bacterium]|nr:guanylate kinase [Alphaproteobacteria bacterium]OJV13834.1 MAG: guanylate kinase [Alphaproteobacteria bacterium 33-17]